jgi:hypothetical protein
MSTKIDGEESDTSSESESAKIGIIALRSGSCSSLSKRSTITYQIGVLSGSDTPTSSFEPAEIYLRITANTGKGMFSNDWVSLSTVSEAIDDLPSSQGLTSPSLHAIYFGKSLNTSGFLLAVLREEGLVVTLAGKRPSYQKTDFSSFVTALSEVADREVQPGPATPIEKARKKRGKQT